MVKEKGSSGAVIKSFYIPGEEGISEYWRRNKSSVVSLELARLLGALRKLTGYLGVNVGSIIWEGMKSPVETSAIILDPSMIRGKYPIPASKTDYMVGITVREAYRRIEWSEKAEKLAWGKVGKMDSVKRYKFRLYFEMAERIYFDILANRSILGLYAEVARLLDFKVAKNNLLPLPSVEELFYLWWSIAADRNSRGYQEAFSGKTHEWATLDRVINYGEPLQLLNSIIDPLITVCCSRRSVLERCQYRADLYVERWPQLLEMVKLWPTDRKTYLMDEEGDNYAAVEPAARVSEATLRVIEAALAENLDMTASVRKVCRDDEDTITIKTGSIILPMEEKLDQQLFLRLKAGLRLRSKRRNVVSRGLKSGSIDPRRLYRAPITGEVFLYKKAVHEMDHEVVLLVDASSSMVGPKWRSSQRVFYALYEAMKELNPHTQVFAYNEISNICYLTELAKRGRLFTVVPRGKTASGEAIVATALLLMQRKKMRPSLLIHLTDGASNWGSEVKYGIEFCKKQHIDLITLGLGCNKESREALKNEYGEQVRFVDDLKTLPRKFIELVAHITRY